MCLRVGGVQPQRCIPMPRLCDRVQVDACDDVADGERDQAMCRTRRRAGVLLAGASQPQVLLVESGAERSRSRTCIETKSGPVTAMIPASSFICQLSGHASIVCQTTDARSRRARNRAGHIVGIHAEGRHERPALCLGGRAPAARYDDHPLCLPGAACPATRPVQLRTCPRSLRHPAVDECAPAGPQRQGLVDVRAEQAPVGRALPTKLTALGRRQLKVASAAVRRVEQDDAGQSG